MTTDRFDRRLEEGLQQVALPTFPDYFDDILAVTGRMRQRPAWVFPERWIPMVDFAQRPASARPVSWRSILIGAALILALTAAAVAIVGSPGPTIRSPVGLARNGEIGIVADGRLTVGERTLVTDGVHSVAFSPDGRSVAYLRDAIGSPGFQLAVSDVATGAQRFSQRGAYGPESVGADRFQFAWSPDGSRIAFESGEAEGNGLHTGAVSIIDLRDASERDLAVGFPIGEVSWRPDGADLVVRGWKADRAGLFLVRPEGTDVRQIVIAEDGEDDLGQPVWSPDGRRIAYVYGDRDVTGTEQARLHLMDADGSNDTIPFDPAGVQDYWPVWSPDGTRIALSQFTYDDEEWIAIQPVPGGQRIEPDGRRTLTGDLARVVWAPDGTVLLVREPDGHLRRMDPATGRSEPFMLDVDALPSWQRLAP